MADAAASSDPSRYTVVARRFRPQGFEEVVGQAAVLRSLRSALDEGRVPHALLFSGSRGVGKTTMARIIARALNCEKGVSSTPCGSCHPCSTILAGNNPDVVEIDAASHNLVDDIRELRDRVGFASMGSRYKVYILDEVHMLTRNAFNAFLKTLEEPPPKVVFVLATTELHKVPETIRSRCRVELFQRIDEHDIAARLQVICDAESLDVDASVLQEIAVGSRGGMRDAETALERLLPLAAAAAGTFGLEDYRKLVHRVGLDSVVELVVALSRGDAAAGLRFAAASAATGVDEREALGEVVDALRAMLLLAVDGAETGLVPHSGALRAQLVAAAETAGRDRIDAMIHAGLDGRDRLRRLDDRRLVLEIALLRMAEAGTVPTLAQLADALHSGAPITAGAAAATPSAAVAGTGAPPPVPGGMLGEALKAGVLAALASKKPMLQSTIESCRVSGPDDDGVVHLALQSTRKMHADRLASSEVRGLLGEVFREVAGRPVELRVVGKDADGQSATTKAPRAGGGDLGAPKPGPAVDRVLERFEGKLLEDD